MPLSCPDLRGEPLLGLLRDLFYCALHAVQESVNLTPHEVEILACACSLETENAYFDGLDDSQLSIVVRNRAEVLSNLLLGYLELQDANPRVEKLDLAVRHD